MSLHDGSGTLLKGQEKVRAKSYSGGTDYSASVSVAACRDNEWSFQTVVLLKKNKKKNKLEFQDNAPETVSTIGTLVFLYKY